jgi:hypothetical protein
MKAQPPSPCSGVQAGEEPCPGVQALTFFHALVSGFPRGKKEHHARTENGGKKKSVIAKLRRKQPPQPEASLVGSEVCLIWPH